MGTTARRTIDASKNEEALVECARQGSGTAGIRRGRPPPEFELGQRAQEQLFTRGVYEMIERTELGEELLHGARSADRRRAPPRRAASRTRTSRLDTTTTRAGPINEIGSVMRFIGITLTTR